MQYPTSARMDQIRAATVRGWEGSGIGLLAALHQLHRWDASTSVYYLAALRREALGTAIRVNAQRGCGRVQELDRGEAMSSSTPTGDNHVSGARRRRILVIDNDRDIAEIVYAVLVDEGYDVSLLSAVEPDAIRVAIGQLEPDCVLLDGQGPGVYGQSWVEAAWLSSRSRQVPVIMFTVDAQAQREGQEATSQRSLHARFNAVIPKPFDLDELITAVSRAVGQSVPFEVSELAETERTNQLKAKLEAPVKMSIYAVRRCWWYRSRGPSTWFRNRTLGLVGAISPPTLRVFTCTNQDRSRPAAGVTVESPLCHLL